MPRHLAIVPAYNEEASVGAVIDDLVRHAPDFDVLVITTGPPTPPPTSPARPAP